MNQRTRILQELGEEFEHAITHPPAHQRLRRMSGGGLAGHAVVAASVAITLAIGASACSSWAPTNAFLLAAPNSTQASN